KPCNQVIQRRTLIFDFGHHITLPAESPFGVSAFERLQHELRLPLAQVTEAIALEPTKPSNMIEASHHRSDFVVVAEIFLYAPILIFVEFGRGRIKPDPC